eukprot:4303619-Ditylum_brightwellii.AAC.1
MGFVEAGVKVSKDSLVWERDACRKGGATWALGSKAVDLGGWRCASGEGLLGFVGLGAERCLWSELVLVRCVETVWRWYLLWRVGGFGWALR